MRADQLQGCQIGPDYFPAQSGNPGAAVDGTAEEESWDGVDRERVRRRLETAG